MGPAPTLPVKPPWAHLGHRQRPRGYLITPVDARWGPRSADSPSGILLFLPKSNLLDLLPGIRYGSYYNSRGGDWLRLRWLIQGKRAEDGGHNLVNTVTANQ